MLDDSRAKIEFLRMRIMKVRQARQQQHARGDAPPPNGEATSNKGNYCLFINNKFCFYDYTIPSANLPTISFKRVT